MAIINHAPPTTANGIAYFFPAVRYVVGTISTQKNVAAAVGGSTNAMPIPHNNMRATVMLAPFFLIKFFILKIITYESSFKDSLHRS